MFPLLKSRRAYYLVLFALLLAYGCFAYVGMAKDAPRECPVLEVVE